MLLLLLSLNELTLHKCKQILRKIFYSYALYISDSSLLFSFLNYYL